MLKQAILYILLSIVVVIFAKYLHILVVYIDTIFTYLSIKLAPVFSKTALGLVIRKTIVLILLPVIIVGIPALIYRAVKGKQMPYFIAVTWLVWLIIVISNILIS